MSVFLPSAPASRDLSVRSAYAEFLAATASPEPGFPRAVAIREWVPGVTTAPIALAAATTTPAATWLPRPANAGHIEQAVALLSTTVMIAVSAGFPALTVWYGYHLSRP